MTDAPSARACPAPDKRFRTVFRELAETSAEMHRQVGRPLSAYLCECGLWHLRNEDKRARKQRAYRTRKRHRQAMLRRIMPMIIAAEHAEEWIW